MDVVAAAEWAGPGECAGRGLFEVPAGLLEPVVMAAQGCEVVGGGGAAVLVVGGVVLVAALWSLSAAGGDAGAVADLGVAAESGAG